MTSWVLLTCTLELCKNRACKLSFSSACSADFSGLPFCFQQMPSKSFKIRVLNIQNVLIFGLSVLKLGRCLRT